MDLAAVKLANHAERFSVKAKKSESLKKDPIVRAALEGAGKPNKITYTVDTKEITEFGEFKAREKLVIEGDSFNIGEQLEEILEKIGNFSKQVKDIGKTERSQGPLFEKEE